ncbi:hypothetical protein MRX96_019029 [Rhipicephalus microplus]
MCGSFISRLLCQPGARQGVTARGGRVQAAPERAPGAELASRAAAATKAKHGGHFRETRVPRRSAGPSRGPGASSRGSCCPNASHGTSLPAAGAKTAARHERALPIKPPEAAPRGAPPTAATLRAARRRNSNAPCAGGEELCVDLCARARTQRARALWSASQLRGNVPTSSDARVPLEWTKLRRRLPLRRVCAPKAERRRCRTASSVTRRLRRATRLAAAADEREAAVVISAGAGTAASAADVFAVAWRPSRQEFLPPTAAREEVPFCRPCLQLELRLVGRRRERLRGGQTSLPKRWCASLECDGIRILASLIGGRASRIELGRVLWEGARF